MIGHPQAWATIFVTSWYRRSLIEMCLERSRFFPLKVTIKITERVRTRLGCTCIKDGHDILHHNAKNPCEWHFLFESFAATRHSERIRGLNVDFERPSAVRDSEQLLAFGSCQFFASTFPQLISLGWKNDWRSRANHTPRPLVPPSTLRSLTLGGACNGPLARINGLTSFAFGDNRQKISAENFRLFLSNSQSLESLGLGMVGFRGNVNGPPVDLLKINSLRINFRCKRLSTIFRVPALRRISALRISLLDQNGIHSLHATGDDISLHACPWTDPAAEEVWRDVTGNAQPTIRHISLFDGSEGGLRVRGYENVLIPLMGDAHTLEISREYTQCWVNDIWEHLREFGSQLKIIHFEVSVDSMEPLQGPDTTYDDFVFKELEGLAKWRFEQGQPFSAIERMVVSEDPEANRQQEEIWRRFYEGRGIYQYLVPA